MPFLKKILRVLLINTWSLLSQSLKLSLDAVPENLTLQQVKEAAEKIPGVKNMHHIHLWAISTTRNALTAHIVVDGKSQLSEIETIKHNVKHALEHLNIQHATLEVEPSEENCETEDC